MRCVLAAAVVLAAGCGADLQADAVCVTSAGYTLFSARVPGVTSAPLPPMQLAFSVGSALPDLTKGGVHDVRVLVRSFDLEASASTAFVSGLAVSALPPAGSSLPKLPLGTYQRPPAAAGSTLHVPGNGADVFPYLQSGRLLLELSGALDPSQAPSGTFTADARLCAEVNGSVQYL